MKIKLTGKTDKGSEVIKTLYLEKDMRQIVMGIRKEVQSENPFTLIISAKNLDKVPAKRAREIKEYVTELEKNWEHIMGNYGAKKEDYQLEIV
jgi:hypothetical protein